MTKKLRLLRFFLHCGCERRARVDYEAEMRVAFAEQ